MRRKPIVFISSVLGILVLFQHNNCDVTPHGTGESGLSSFCRGEDCAGQPNSSYLSITVREPEVVVGPMVSQVTIHGECNEGEFRNKAVVFWQLTDYQGNLLRATRPEEFDCNAPDLVEGVCQGGYFSLRLSGWFGNLYAEHRAKLNIVGFDKNCRPYDNGLAGEQTVYLLPLIGF